MGSLRYRQHHKHQHQQYQDQHHSDHQVESKEDASDAVRKVNGSNFNGGRIRVELANACSDGDPGSGRDRDSGSRAR